MGYNKQKITLGNEFDERKIMYYLGIDLGGTNIAVGVVDENCKIVKKGSVPTKAEREADEIIAVYKGLGIELTLYKEMNGWICLAGKRG